VGWEYYDGNFPVFEPDEPVSAQEMLYSVKRIMGQFYQFKYMFAIAANILSFPMLIFFLHNIRKGWLHWYRPWRNNLIRFCGWFVVKGWAADFKKGTFLQRLDNARDRMKTRQDRKGRLLLRQGSETPWPGTTGK
jgi:hypothetical protein